METLVLFMLTFVGFYLTLYAADLAKHAVTP